MCHIDGKDRFTYCTDTKGGGLTYHTDTRVDLHVALTFRMDLICHVDTEDRLKCHNDHFSTKLPHKFRR